MSKQRVVLLITDGWGVGADNSTNPVYVAQPPNLSQFKKDYLYGTLQASGIAVGLPWQEEGNSEVGHLTIGAGKTIYQHYPRISIAIKNGDFNKNKVLKEALNHAEENRSAVHLVGLLSEGNVHSSLEHLEALIDITKETKVAKIYLHLFSDGKDSRPKSFLDLLEKLYKKIGSGSRFIIASLSGRYFAMDRDRHWDRTQEAYQAMLGQKDTTENLPNYVKGQYEKDLNDQYLSPICVGPEKHPIRDNDSVIFFNFREDSMRQIVAPFALKNFDEFKTTPLKNTYITTFTRYSDQFQVEVAFPPEEVTQTLGKVLSDNSQTQLRVAETEKYAHVTYFFNGLKDKPLENEFRVLIPSRNLMHHDEHPEMMAPAIADRVIQAIEEGDMDFTLANFANPDMIAHTGNFDAAVRAVKVVDEQIGNIVQAALVNDVAVIITSDHGNVERMSNPLTGEPETQHDLSPVHFYLIGNRFKNKNQKNNGGSSSSVGVLADISPTVLEIMGLPKPKEMSGVSLLRQLW